MKLILGLAALTVISTAYGASLLKKDRCKDVINSTAEYEPGTKVFKGCRLNDVEENSLYAKLGLAKGDIIKVAADSPDGKSLDLQNSSRAQR